MPLLQFQLAKLPKTRFAPDAFDSIRPTVADPSNSLIGTRETKQIAFQTRVLVFASRELPAVAAVHALAEGRHRLIGGAGLGLCVGDLGLLALATCHTERETNRLASERRYGNFLLNARKTPYRTHSHRSSG